MPGSSGANRLSRDAERKYSAETMSMLNEMLMRKRPDFQAFFRIRSNRGQAKFSGC
jgi:hypothetical protein